MAGNGLWEALGHFVSAASANDQRKRQEQLQKRGKVKIQGGRIQFSGVGEAPEQVGESCRCSGKR